MAISSSNYTNNASLKAVIATASSFDLRQIRIRVSVGTSWQLPYNADQVYGFIKDLLPSGGCLERFITYPLNVNAALTQKTVPVSGGGHITLVDFLNGLPSNVIWTPRIDCFSSSVAADSQSFMDLNAHLKNPPGTIGLDEYAKFCASHQNQSDRTKVLQEARYGNKGGKWLHMAVNCAGGYYPSYGYADAIDIASDANFQINTSSLNSAKADTNIQKIVVYTDIPEPLGTIEQHFHSNCAPVVTGFKNLVATIKSIGVKQICYLFVIEQYGAPPSGKFTWDSLKLICNGISMYATFKGLLAGL